MDLSIKLNIAHFLFLVVKPNAMEMTPQRLHSTFKEISLFYIICIKIQLQN